MFRKLFFSLLGLALLPAAAGLVTGLYEALVVLQLSEQGSRVLRDFFGGVFIWLVIFLLITRPVRSYILAHELSHLIAAWLSGVATGKLRVHRHGGSVEVARSTVWIALAPYFVPLYSLLLLAAHFLAKLWWDPIHWQAWLPLALGLTWSYHLSFTLLALLRHQSDLTPYGRLGALPLILLLNLLPLCIGAAAFNQRPLMEDFKDFTEPAIRYYQQVTLSVLELGRVVWNREGD